MINSNNSKINSKGSMRPQGLLHHIFSHPWLYFAVFITLSLVVWLPNNFISYNSIIGEAYEAFHGAWNLERFGFQWYGLQDEATNPTIQAHPFLYIHHPNIGLYFSYLLRVAGIKTVELHNFASGFIYLAGIVLGCFFFRRINHHKEASLLFLILVCTNLYSVNDWVFNIHRAFSYLSVFLVFISVYYLLHTDKKTFLHHATLIIGLILTIGADYMFFMLTVFTGIFYALAPNIDTGRRYLRNIAIVFLLLVYTGLIFLARQLQVLLGIGWEVWKGDFLYQILNRFHLEFLYPGDWSKATEAFYKNHFVLNPGFTPGSNLSSILNDFFSNIGVSFTRYVLDLHAGSVINYTLVGIIIFAILLISIIINLVPTSTTKERKPSRVLAAVYEYYYYICLISVFLSIFASMIVNSTLISTPATRYIVYVLAGLTIGTFLLLSFDIFKINRAFFAEPVIASNREIAVFSLSLLLAYSTMYAVVPSYFRQWFPAFNGSGICLTVWTILILLPPINKFRRTKFRNHFSLILIFLFAMKLLTIVPLLLLPPTKPGTYHSSLRAIAGHTVVSNFTPAAVASYTGSFSASLNEFALEDLPDLSHFDPRVDYKYFCERDTENPIYKWPDYLILFAPNLYPSLIAKYEQAGIPIVDRGTSHVLLSLKNHWKANRNRKDISVRAPKDLKGFRSKPDTILLTWVKSENARKYFVEMSYDGISFQKIGVVYNTQDTKYVIGNVSKTNTYKFRVIANRGRFYSKYSRTVTVPPSK